jgi:hypothetical protein
MPSTNTITGLPPNASIDFQVEALSGYWTRTMEFASQHFEAQESGWSPTQTVTILASSVSPNPSPTIPEFLSLAIVPLFVIIPVIISIIARKNSHLKAYN